jgi:hypothetical protein
MARYIISEQQYELYQKTNNFPDSETPVSGEIVWRALSKANDNLGEALRLVQLAMQYTGEYPGLEKQLNEISQDISCGANRVIDCHTHNFPVPSLSLLNTIREGINPRSGTTNSSDDLLRTPPVYR